MTKRNRAELVKLVFVLRGKTERLEVSEAGNAKLVETEIENIVNNANTLLQNPNYMRERRLLKAVMETNISLR